MVSRGARGIETFEIAKGLALMSDIAQGSKEGMEVVLSSLSRLSKQGAKYESGS